MGYNILDYPGADYVCMSVLYVYRAIKKAPLMAGSGAEGGEKYFSARFYRERHNFFMAFSALILLRVSASFLYKKSSASTGGL